MSDELTRTPSDGAAFSAGYHFVERHIHTADTHAPYPAWYEWMVRQAFWEGIRWAREQAKTGGDDAKS